MQDDGEFSAALDHAFPLSSQSIAREVGIDLSKNVELAHYGADSSDLHDYDGWFHLAGKVIEGGPLSAERRFFSSCSPVGWAFAFQASSHHCELIGFI